MQDKTPYNDKGQPHGLWEGYHYNGNLCNKGSYLNGERHGPWEWYYYNGNLGFKGKYLKGEYIGLWIWGIANGLIEEIEFYAR